jgi:hypothetical protein
VTSIDLQAPTSPVQRGTTVTARVGLDPDGAALAAIRLRLTAPPEQFADITVTNLAFTGVGAAFSHSPQTGGATLVAGVRLSGAPGPLDLLDVSFRAIGTPGQGHAIGVEVLEAVALDGRRLRFVPVTARVDVEPGDPEILTSALAAARAGVPYHALLRAQGGQAPYTWTISGALPTGLALSPAGIVAGTAQFAGTAAFQVRVADASTPGPRVDTADLTLTVLEAPLRILTTELPPAAPDRTYTVPLQHSGGRAPIVWEASGLPPGLTISGSDIVGSPTDTLSDYTPLPITLAARDAADPPQLAQVTLELPRVAALPIATFALDAPGAVAVGRDLVLVEYTLEASAGVTKGASDPDLESALNDAKEAVMAELFDLLGRPDIPDRGRDDASPGLGPDGSGDDGTGVGIGPGEGPDGPEPDDWGPPNPDQDRQDRIDQLLQEYVELDEATESSSKVHAVVWIEIDGEELDAARLEVGRGFRPTRAIATGRRARSTPGLPLPPRGGVLANAAVTAAIALGGKPLMGWVRRRMDDALAQERARPSRSVANLPASPPLPGPDDVRRVLAAAAAATQGTTRQINFGQRSKRWALASLGTVLGGALVGGRRGALFLGIPQALAAGVGATIVTTRTEWLVDRLRDRLRNPQPEELSDPDSHRSRVTLRLTPGAHEVTVRWRGSVIGATAGSIYDLSRSLASGLSYQISLAPRNPQEWPRLIGSTQVNGGGLALSGSDVHRVSLFSSDLDIVVATAAGLRLLAGRGDGTFAEPQPFDDSAAATYSTLLVDRMDQYGRSSLAAVQDTTLDLKLNAGVRAFVHRSVAFDEVQSDEIRDITAGDLDGDAWAEFVVAIGEQIAIVEDLGGLFAETPTPATVRVLQASSPIAHDPVTSVLCVPPPDTTSPARVQHVVLAHRLDGRALLRHNNAGQLAPPIPLSGSVSAPRAQPIDFVIDRNGHLVLAFRQKSTLEFRQRSGANWTSLPVVSLPFRPAELAQGPASTGGVAVAAHRRGIVMLLTLAHPDAEPVVWPLYLGSGPTSIGSAEGLLAVTDSDAGRLLLYR